jgi:hypothetical protein
MESLPFRAMAIAGFRTRSRVYSIAPLPPVHPFYFQKYDFTNTRYSKLRFGHIFHLGCGSFTAMPE